MSSKKIYGQAPVALTCNPSYTEGRDQEDCGLKLAWANSLRNSISIKPIKKKMLLEWFKV
jgi:hypothetical protein